MKEKSVVFPKFRTLKLFSPLFRALSCFWLCFRCEILLEMFLVLQIFHSFHCNLQVILSWFCLARQRHDDGGEAKDHNQLEERVALSFRNNHNSKTHAKGCERTHSCNSSTRWFRTRFNIWSVRKSQKFFWYFISPSNSLNDFRCFDRKCAENARKELILRWTKRHQNLHQTQHENGKRDNERPSSTV